MAEEENIPADVVLIDFEKAVDSLEWSFVEKSLTFLTFNITIKG